MMTLHEIGLKTGTDKATYHKYCDFYQQHLPIRGFNGRLLEIGVWEGSSLRMWKEWYPNAEIVGIDIEIRTQIEGVTLIEMDASDAEKLSTLGNLDIIIDDASHMCSHQQIAFNHLYNNQLNTGGIYAIEDLQTSFWGQYRDTSETTYDYIKSKHSAHIEFNRDGLNDSITILIPKQ